MEQTKQPIDERALKELDAIAGGLKGGAGIEDIIDVVGVLSGVKPSAFVGGDERIISNESLDRLGLKYTTSSIKNIVYVSRDFKTAERLAKLHEIVWGKNAKFPDENREIGRLLGYPTTATEYFLQRLPVYGTPDELPIIKVKRTMGTVSEHFQSLILSPEHYEEELKNYCEPLENAVCTMAPKTYRALKRATLKENLKRVFSKLVRKNREPGILTKIV